MITHEVSELNPAHTAAATATPGRQRRIALVGAGRVAPFHAEALSQVPGVRLVAVCDTDEAKARALASRWKVPDVVRSVDELARLGVDVAHVITPPDLHVGVAQQLLAQGIGVLVEKPVALSNAEAAQLAEDARRRGLPFGVNHNHVYHPAFVRLLDQVRAGRIGRVEHVHACWVVPLAQLDAGDFSHWMFREPRNVVYEQATHPISQVHALVGPVRRISSRTLGTRELLPGQIFHDRWAVAAEAERGTVELYMAFGQSFARSTITVLGSDGMLEADFVHNTLTFEEKTPWLDFWNSFLAGSRRSRTLLWQSTLELSRYAAFTLGVGPRRDPYFVSMRQSFEAFYASLSDAGQFAGVGHLASEVVEWCDSIAQAAAPSRTARRQVVPAPLPPRPGEVVVLGGTGFIGRRVVAQLLADGCPTTLVARRAHGLSPEIEAGLDDGRLRFLSGRLEDRESLVRAMEGADTVIHLATGAGDTWDEVKYAMVDGSVFLAETALKAGVKRFVYVSSIAALYNGYDRGGDRIEDSLEVDPQPETRDVYSRGKLEAELALGRLHRERGLPLVIVRPGVVLGRGTPMQHSGFGNWIRDNRCVGWSKGDTPLPLVTSDDVADAIVRVVKFKGADLDGKALNLCTNVPITAADAVAELRRVTGRNITFHPQPLWLGQLFELGKWVVKVVGRRPNTRFPSYRDLKTRALPLPYTARTAREVLGWTPLEEREAFMDQAIRIYGDRQRPA